jgi:hypothetical protein
MAAVYGIADLVFSWNPIAAKPYIDHRASPVFRAAPLLGFGVVAEALNGWIAALAFFAIERSLVGGVARRGIVFGSIVWGFWVISGTMSAFVWLELPASLALVNLLFGLLKCLAIGLAMAWLWRIRPARSADYPALPSSASNIGLR